MKHIINRKWFFSYLFMLSFSLSAAVKSETDKNTNAAVTHMGNHAWNFDVYLDDSLIGFHNFNVKNNKSETFVSINAEFAVQFLFITVYEYKHKNTEVWKNNCLKNLNSNTDTNGELLTVNLNKKGDNSVIKSTKFSESDEVDEAPELSGNSYTKTSCIRSFAYWNPDLIKSRALLNSQTGELVNIDFSYKGTEIYTLNNKKIQSERYQLLGKDKQGKDIEIDLWYTKNKRWLALKSKLDNGSYLRYQLNNEVSL